MPKYSKSQKAAMRKVPTERTQQKIDKSVAILHEFNSTFPGFVKGHLTDNGRCLHCEDTILKKWEEYKNMATKPEWKIAYHCGNYKLEEEDYDEVFPNHIKVSGSGKSITFVSCDKCN